VNVLEFTLMARDSASSIVEAAKRRILAANEEVAQSFRKTQDYSWQKESASGSLNGLVDSSAQKATQEQHVKLLKDLKKAQEEAKQGTASLTDVLVAFGQRSEKLPGSLGPVSKSIAEFGHQIHGLEMGLLRVAGVGYVAWKAFSLVKDASLGFAGMFGGYKSDKTLDEMAKKAEEAKRRTEQMVDAASKLDEAAMDKIQKGYQDLAEDADRAATAIDRAAEAHKRVRDTKLSAGMSELDLSEAQARAQSQADPQENKRISLLWGNARRQLDTESAIDAADRSVEDAELRLRVAKQAAGNAEKERLQLEQQRAEAEAALDANRSAFLALGRRPTSEAAANKWDAQVDSTEIERAIIVARIDALEKRKPMLDWDKAREGLEAAQGTLDSARSAAADAARRREINAANYAAEADDYNRELQKAMDEVQDKEREAAAERLRLDRERAEEQRRLMLDNLRAQESAEKDMASSAADRLSRAQAEVSRTWSWYKDPSSWQGELKDERADVAAQKQFEKDSSRLQGQTNWRSRNLSDGDEIVRRVIFAREEESAAREALVAIERNTRDLAAKIDYLMAMKA